MIKNYDVAVVCKILDGMSLHQRREWIVKARMAERRKNFEDIARRHRFTAWLLAKAVHGKANWSPRIVKALQSDLALDLTAFLTEKEAAKYQKTKTHH
ncbi:MAG: hypothetical protein WCX88_03005 [Patescibacteria group bacterium]